MVTSYIEKRLVNLAPYRTGTIEAAAAAEGLIGKPYAFHALDWLNVHVNAPVEVR